MTFVGPRFLPCFCVSLVMHAGVLALPGGPSAERAQGDVAPERVVEVRLETPAPRRVVASRQMLPTPPPMPAAPEGPGPCESQAAVAPAPELPPPAPRPAAFTRSPVPPAPRPEAGRALWRDFAHAHAAPPPAASVGQEVPPTEPAIAARSPQSENARARYWERVRADITRALSYPTVSRRGREEGRVVVRIVLARDGQLAGVETLPGVSPALVEAARRAVEAAAPFPAPDFPLDGETIAADLPIRFSLMQP